MFEKLDVLSYLKERGSILNDNNLTNLPDKHKNTSLESGAKCDLSYHQGYRDGIQSLLSIINVCWQNEYDYMEEESDRMYLEHLQTRCSEVMTSTEGYPNKSAAARQIEHWNKVDCIKYLKDTDNWKE